MKKLLLSKKMLGSLFGITLVMGAVTAAAVACVDPTTSSKLQLTTTITNEPKKTTEATLGADYIMDLSDVNSHMINGMTDPYKCFQIFADNLDSAGYDIKDHAPLKDKGFTTFSAYAQDLNTKVKEYVKAIANLPKIKALRDSYTTVLFAETTQEFDSNNATKIDNYFYQQPYLFPILYAKPDSATPGFGLYMPMPNNHKADKYWDNWYGIGASFNSTNSQDQGWRTDLYDAWRGTADYVFYNYDENKLSSNTTAESFEQLFKKSVNNPNIIPVNFQFDYASIWGPVGTVYFAEAYAKRLGVTQADLDSIAAKKPKFPTKNELAHIRPKTTPEQSDEVNLGTQYYSVWDHMIALGIQPDYAVKYVEKGKYQKVAGLFNDMVDLTKTNFDFKINTQSIAEAKLYAIATNEDRWTKSIGKVVDSSGNKDIKGVFSQRGDNYKGRSEFNIQFYDRKNHKLHNIKQKEGQPKKLFVEPSDEQTSH